MPWTSARQTTCWTANCARLPSMPYRARTPQSRGPRQPTLKTMFWCRSGTPGRPGYARPIPRIDIPRQNRPGFADTAATGEQWRSFLFVEGERRGASLATRQRPPRACANRRARSRGADPGHHPAGLAGGRLGTSAGAGQADDARGRDRCPGRRNQASHPGQRGAGRSQPSGRGHERADRALAAKRRAATPIPVRRRPRTADSAGGACGCRSTRSSPKAAKRRCKPRDPSLASGRSAPPRSSTSCCDWPDTMRGPMRPIPSPSTLSRWC